MTEQQTPEQPTLPAIAVHFNVPLPNGQVMNLAAHDAIMLRDNLNAIIGQFEASQEPAPKQRARAHGPAPKRRAKKK